MLYCPITPIIYSTHATDNVITLNESVKFVFYGLSPFEERIYIDEVI